MRRLLVRMGLALSLGVAMASSAWLAGPTSVSAQVATPKTAAELCRVLDAAGDLALYGLTRGECVILLKGPATEQSSDFISGVCGYTSSLEYLGVTNKGQCIQAVRELGGPP